jgi:hypothetical protein
MPKSSGFLAETTHEVTYTGTYYYLAHFSKFVGPGAIRVQTAGKAKACICGSRAHLSISNLHEAVSRIATDTTTAPEPTAETGRFANTH